MQIQASKQTSVFHGIRHFVALALIAAGATFANAENSPIGELSPAIQDVIQKVVPSVKWKEFAKHQDNEGTFLNIFGETEQGNRVAVEVSPDGKVTDVEKAVDASALPESLHKLIAEQLPDFKPGEYLQKFEDENLKALDPSSCIYEVSGPVSEGKSKKLTVELKPGGTFLSIKTEVEVAEVPREIMSALAAKAPKMKVSYAVRIIQSGEVTSFLLSSPKGRTAYISADGKEVLLHKE